MTTKRKRRKYIDEFKKLVVQLYESRRPRAEIVREYDLIHSAFGKWIKQYNNSGSFTEKDNRISEQEEIIKLRKENQRLAMENDIFT